jgi:Family of unknown function (DUF6134)
MEHMERDGGSRRSEQVGLATYGPLAFGSLVLLRAGASLPYLRSLKVGQIQLERGETDRIEPIQSFGIGLAAVLVAGLFAGSAAMSAQGHACDHPPGQEVYKVDNETFGEIGRHVITFSCQGEELLVETKISVNITMLYTLDGSYREVWRGDRLISFDSKVNDNGEQFEVSADAEGDKMVIDGHSGVIEAPATIVSDHPWNFAVLDRPLLFDARRGKLRHVQIDSAGNEALLIGGREVPAKKYRMTGDRERVLWYGGDGTWLQAQLEYGGAKVLVTRQE